MDKGTEGTNLPNSKSSADKGLKQFAGVSNTSKLYKRGIRVCTGTGLGAALSTCLQVCQNSFPFTTCTKAKYFYMIYNDVRATSGETPFFFSFSLDWPLPHSWRFSPGTNGANSSGT